MICSFNSSTIGCEFTSPSPQTVTIITQDATAKPTIIVSVSISSLVLLGIVVATLVVATLVFLFRRGSMQRCCMCRMRTAPANHEEWIPMDSNGANRYGDTLCLYDEGFESDR